MKLSDKAITAIESNNKVKARLALAFDKSGFTIERWISHNEVNGDLTKIASVQIITEETGLSEDEVLKSCEAENKVNA